MLLVKNPIICAGSSGILGGWIFKKSIIFEGFLGALGEVDVGFGAESEVWCVSLQGLGKIGKKKAFENVRKLYENV